MWEINFFAPSSPFPLSWEGHFKIHPYQSPCLRCKPSSSSSLFTTTTVDGAKRGSKGEGDNLFPWEGESTLYSLFPRGGLLLLLLLLPLPNWKAAFPPLTKTLKEAQGSLSTSAAVSVLHKGWGCSSACFLQTGGGGGGGGSFWRFRLPLLLLRLSIFVFCALGSKRKEVRENVTSQMRKKKFLFLRAMS